MHRLVLVLLLAGCAHNGSTASENAATVARIEACSAREVVLMPWSSESTLVEEQEYRHLVKEVSDELAMSAQDRISALRKFARVSSGTECAQGIRVEGRVVSLIHKSRKYHYKIAGRILECGTERPLGSFEILEQNKDASSLAARLADSLASELDNDDICAQLAGQAVR